MPEIEEDYLIVKLREFGSVFDENTGKAPSDRSEEEIRKEAVDEIMAMKRNKANYATPKETEIYTKEKLRLEKMFNEGMEWMTVEDGYRLKEFREIEKLKKLKKETEKWTQANQ